MSETGALLSRRGEESGDARMIEKAIKQRWAIPEKLMQALPNKMGLLALSDNSAPRDAIAAARVLVQMHGQNQSADEPEPEITVNHVGLVEHNHTHSVEQRIKDYEDVFYEEIGTEEIGTDGSGEAASSEDEGDVPSDGAGESVDHKETASKAGKVSSKRK